MTENRYIPDLYLEKFVQGLLSSREMEEIYKLLESDEQLKQHISEIQLSNAAFRGSPLYSEALKNIVNKASKKKIHNRKKHPPLWQYAGASLVACFLIFTFLPNEGFLFNSNTKKSFSEFGSDVRLKGMLPELNIYRKQKDYVEEIANHQLVSNYDVLQLRYQGAGYQFGVIFSIDGRGQVTLHFPANEVESTRIQSEGNVALPYAYELDDAPGFERFFLLVSHSSLNVDEILKKGNVLANSELAATNEKITMPAEVYQTSVLLVKDK